MGNFVAQVGTSFPIDICHGALALFPGVNPQASVSSGGRSVQLFDFSKDIGIGHLSGQASGSYFTGLCGPAYASAMTLTGSVSDVQPPVAAQLSVLITPDAQQVGFVIGMNVGFSFAFKFKNIIKDVDVSYSTNVDLMELLFEVIIRAVSNLTSFVQYDSSGFPPSLGSVWALFQENDDIWLGDNSDLFNPSLTLQVNLLDFIGEAELTTVLNRLADVGLTLALGPELELGLDVELGLTGGSVNGYPVAPLEYQGNYVGTLRGVSDLPADRVAIQLSHQASDVVMSFALFYDVQFLKYYHSANTLNLPFLQDLGINVNQNQLFNVIFGALGSQGQPLGSTEVVFEPA